MRNMWLHIWKGCRKIPKVYIYSTIIGGLLILAALIWVDADPWTFWLLPLGLIPASLGTLPVAAKLLPEWFKQIDNDKDQQGESKEHKQKRGLAFQVARVAESFEDLHTWHAHVLGIMGVIITLLGVWLAWQDSKIHDAQKQIEDKQEQIEDNQKTIATENLLFSVNKEFEDLFDLPLRRRFYRAYNLMNTADPKLITPSEQQQLVADLANETNSLSADYALFSNSAHRGIRLLITPDLLMDYPATFTGRSNRFANAEIQTEIANYHTTLVRTINVLDALAQIDMMTNDHGNAVFKQKLFYHSVTNRGAGLVQFIFKIDGTNPSGWSTPSLMQALGYTNTIRAP